jgi:hypothetical protein
MLRVTGRPAVLLSPLMLCLAVSSEALASPEEIARLSSTGDARAPHPLMAVRYSIDSTAAVMHRLVPTANGGFCDAPERVLFRFGISRRRVLLTPEAAAEPCVKSALLAHEAEHNRVAGDTIRTFLDRQEAELAQVLRQLKGRHARGKDAAKKPWSSDS